VKEAPRPTIGIVGRLEPPDMTDPPKPRRPRRFALPEHDDHRAVEAIDALLGRHPKPEAEEHLEERGRGRAGARSVFGGLDSRLAFQEAARREDDRVRRYRRPAAVAVLVVDSTSANGTAHKDVERGTWWLIEAATALLRETDRVARVGPGRLRVLMPETRARQAERVLERIRDRWAERADRSGGETVLLRVAAAPVAHGVEAAFARADEAVIDGPASPSERGPA
jgi:GGDEF domain-containing protein